MTRDRSIVVGVVVLAALSALVWKQAKKDEALGSVDKAAADFPDIKGVEELDKISITNGDKGEVVLEKKGADKDAAWVLTKPVQAAANQANVKSLVDNLKELKIKELIASSADDAQKKDYSLDAAHAVHVVAWKGADKKVDDVFGKSGGRGQIVMAEGKPSVYGASGYSSYLYAREVKDWRDRDVFKFDDANANQVQIANPKGPFSFTKGDKGDKWAGTAKGQPIAELDEEKVKDAIRALKNLAADDFGDGKSEADTGLDKPEGVITVALKDNAGKYTLKVGKTASGSSHYAQKEGDGVVYVVNQTVSDWALADTAKFQKAKDAGAPKADAAAAAPHASLPPNHPMIPHE